MGGYPGGSGYWDWTGGFNAIFFSVVVDTDLNLMNVVPVRVDATDPHNARVYYRTEPASAIVQTATFTAPAQFPGGNPTTQTQSSLSGEFSFTSDKAQLPRGCSAFTLQWTPASPFTPIGGEIVTTTATRTPHSPAGSSPLGYAVTIGGMEGGSPIVIPTQYNTMMPQRHTMCSHTRSLSSRKAKQSGLEGAAPILAHTTSRTCQGRYSAGEKLTIIRMTLEPTGAAPCRI